MTTMTTKPEHVGADKALEQERGNPKSVLICLDGTGDSRFMWSKDNPDEIAAAKAQFEALAKKGYTAYKVQEDGTKGEILRNFDSQAERVIMAPRTVGG